MAQLARPYQIALAAAVAALGVFAVWSLALHHGSETGSGGGGSPAGHAAPAAPAPSSASTPGRSPGASTPVYHGAAPGVEGLTRAIDKAHGAVAQSEQNARQLQSKSAQASEEAASAPTTAAPAVHSSTAAPAAVAPKTATHRPASAKGSAAAKEHARQAAAQAMLKSELRQGKTVLLLFWNPKATDDKSVRKALQAVLAHQKGRVAVHVALAGQVGQYGSMTREVQVYQTPTLLIVGKQGLAVTMTGLVDRYAIEQAILEAKKASSKS